MATRARQDWFRGSIELFVDKPKDERIRYDLLTGRVLGKEEVTQMEAANKSTMSSIDSYDESSEYSDYSER